MRQKALLEIRHEIKSRGVTAQNFKPEFCDVTEILKETIYLPIKDVINSNSKLKCVKLPFFQGILRYHTQPGTNFAKEISDRVRVIACLDNIPNIIHSDTEDETISSANWEKIKKLVEFQHRDAIVIVWGDEQDVETAVKEIAIRATEAIEGVPGETRQALIDGTTGFERILPGPDRMYPDTDLPPLAITETKINKIKTQLPQLPWIRRAKYEKYGLEKYVIDDLILTNNAALFDRIVNELKIDPKFTAEFLVRKLNRLRRKKLAVDKISNEQFMAVFNALKNKEIFKQAIPLIIEKWINNDSQSIENVISDFCIMSDSELVKSIQANGKKSELSEIMDLNKKHRYLMGLVMEKIRGKASGKKYQNSSQSFWAQSKS